MCYEVNGWFFLAYLLYFFFFQAEDGIRDAQESRGLGDVYKRQLPILSHVLIQLSENTLTLTTTDMELEISASSKIKSSSEVTFTIYAKDLIDIVRKLPEKTQIKFKIEENKVYLNANKNTFELNTFSHLDFPALPKTQNTSIIKIKQEALKELIENTSF